MHRSETRLRILSQTGSLAPFWFRIQCRNEVCRGGSLGVGFRRCSDIMPGISSEMALSFGSNLSSEGFHGEFMLATHSNEAKIERTLTQLGCAAQNFCKIAGRRLDAFLARNKRRAGKTFPR